MSSKSEITTADANENESHQSQQEQVYIVKRLTREQKWSLLTRLVCFNSLHIDMDFALTEQIFQEIIAQSEENLDYFDDKFVCEFIYVTFMIFKHNLNITRFLKLKSIVQRLHTLYPENVRFGLLYWILLMLTSIIWDDTFKSELELVEFSEKIAQQYDFSQWENNFLEASKWTKLFSQHYKASDPERLENFK